jgi:hypothetical protein
MQLIGPTRNLHSCEPGNPCKAEDESGQLPTGGTFGCVEAEGRKGHEERRGRDQNRR